MARLTEKFFYDHAGYSVPAGEDAETARKENARELLDAYNKASDDGMEFRWEHDDTTSEEFSDNEPFYQLWVCDLLDENGEILESVGGVDFGPDGNDSDDYAHVVEAELAFQHFEGGE